MQQIGHGIPCPILQNSPVFCLSRLCPVVFHRWAFSLPLVTETIGVVIFALPNTLLYLGNQLLCLGTLSEFLFGHTPTHHRYRCSDQTYDLVVHSFPPFSGFQQPSKKGNGLSSISVEALRSPYRNTKRGTQMCAFAPASVSSAVKFLRFRRTIACAAFLLPDLEALTCLSTKQNNYSIFWSRIVHFQNQVFSYHQNLIFGEISSTVNHVLTQLRQISP